MLLTSRLVLLAVGTMVFFLFSVLDRLGGFNNSFGLGFGLGFGRLFCAGRGRSFLCTFAFLFAVALLVDGTLCLLHACLLLFGFLDGGDFGRCFYGRLLYGLFHLININKSFFGNGLCFCGSTFCILADTWTTAAFARLFITFLGLGLNSRFVLRLLIGLGHDGFCWSCVVLLNFLTFLFFLAFGSLSNVRMIHFMVDNGVNQIRAVLVFIVNAHFGGNKFEIVQ